MSATPPGWYDDGHGALRWWDGERWTEHTQSAAIPVAPAVPPPPDPVPVAPGVPPYPGADMQPVYPTYPPAPPAAKKSNLWIVWVVIGVFVLGLVVFAIVLIPMIFASVLGGSAASDEQAAVATVELYDDAWNEVDCDKYFAATTEEFRTDDERPDCGTFEDDAESFNDTVDDYELEVTSVEQQDDVIVVATTESYLSLVDEDGEPLDSPEAVEDKLEYFLVPSGSDWVINEIVAG